MVKVRAVVPVSQMKRTDIIVCTVYFWCLMALLLLSSATDLWVTLDAGRIYEDASYSLRLVLSVIWFSVTICAVCLMFMMAIGRSALRGERQSAISKIVANEWRMLVDTWEHAYPFIMNSVIYLTYDLCVVRITV